MFKAGKDWGFEKEAFIQPFKDGMGVVIETQVPSDVAALEVIIPVVKGMEGKDLSGKEITKRLDEAQKSLSGFKPYKVTIIQEYENPRFFNDKGEPDVKEASGYTNTFILKGAFIKEFGEPSNWNEASQTFFDTLAREVEAGNDVESVVSGHNEFLQKLRDSGKMS